MKSASAAAAAVAAELLDADGGWISPTAAMCSTGARTGLATGGTTAGGTTGTEGVGVGVGEMTDGGITAAGGGAVVVGAGPTAGTVAVCGGWRNATRQPATPARATVTVTRASPRREMGSTGFRRSHE